MGNIWMPGGGGGADLDVVTAASGDVIKGKVIVGANGEPLTGTLELTGNAADSQVLSGKTYYNTDAKTKRTGTMQNRGAVSHALNCGGSYTIPEGYHNGSGKVTANSLASQTGVQNGKTAAGAGQILTGYEAWVNGGRVTGSMTNQGAKTASLNCGGSYTIPAGYHNGSGKVTANSLASQTGVQSGKTAAGAGQILTGYEAWVNGGRVTGTMTNQGAKTASLNCGGSYTIPAGYHNGSGKVTGNSLASQTDATAAAGHILNGKTAWVKGSKITGNIASQGALTLNPGTTAKTGNVSGKYMTGNITVPAISISAAYIKKGQKITFPDGSSITGTFEGFVADSSDLYYKGQNPAGFTIISNGGFFGSGQISAVGASSFRLVSGKKYDLTKYSQLIIEGDFRVSGNHTLVDSFTAGDSTSSANMTIATQNRTSTVTKIVFNFTAKVTKYLFLTIASTDSNSYITRIRLA